MAWASRKEGDRVGMGPVTEQVVESNDIVILHLSAYEDGTDRVFRNVGI